MAKKRKVLEEPDSPAVELDSPAAEPDADDSEEQDQEEDEEDLTKLLEPFNKEQLIDLLRSAASNDPKVLEEIHLVADRDPSHRKLFVHGLGWETTSETLRDVFSKYGELEDCNVVLDKATGKSKGYGFVLFKHRRGAQKALKEPQKKIESRMTACQLASAGPVNTPQSNSITQTQPQPQHQMHAGFHPLETLPRKIFVGNVHSDIPADRLLAFFSQYGEVEEGPLGFDKHTRKSKGFALFIYKTLEGARKALEEPNKTFEGHQLFCQKATDSKLKAAAATPGNVSGGGGFNAPGGGGFNAPGGGGFGVSGGAGFNASNGAAALLGQGLLGGTLPFGSGVPPNQAVLALLAAAGQNPAAFGLTPSVVASLNPGLAAALNAAPQPVAPMATMSQAMPGFGMGNQGYHNPQAYQVNNSYQSGAMGQGHHPRPNNAMGPMGGYGTR